MNTRRSKIIGIFVFIIVLAITLAACDMDDPTNGNANDIYDLTINVEGQGTTDPEPGTHEYDEGATAKIEAIADDNYEFAKWEGSVQEPEEPETSILIESDETVTAIFEEKDDDDDVTELYELIVNTDGEGTVDITPDYSEFEEDTEVDLEAIPSDGWSFDYWEGDVANTENAETTIVMDDNKEVTAHFEEITPETNVYQGSGDEVIDIDRPGNQENYLIYIEGNSDERYFGVQGLDKDGENTNLYVNTTEYYEGVNLSSVDDLIQPNPTEQLEISAETGDDWYIELRPIQEVTEIEPDGSYTNTGDYVFKIDSGISSVNIEGNEAERYFGVTSYNINFDESDLLVNTTEYYEGTVSVDTGMRYFEVNADYGDEWIFNF